MLVGNKSDMIEERQVNKEEIDSFLNFNSIVYYYETSAKTGENVHNIFETLTKDLLNVK
jgi:GTPase SAR1 family protein